MDGSDEDKEPDLISGEDANLYNYQLEARSQGSLSQSRKFGDIDSPRPLPAAQAQPMPSCFIRRHHACMHCIHMNRKYHLPVRAFRKAQRGKSEAGHTSARISHSKSL